MLTALALARRGVGNVWPNPAVGCVIVNEYRIVGRGWTQPGGRPHAETEALARAGDAARGATAFVTLEPCNHHGKTPPCTEAVIHSGIRRGVIAAADPHPLVAGQGVARLQAEGLSVTIGVCAEEALEINAGFFLTVAEGRPLVTLKAAVSLDGRIATRTGHSQWMTGPAARRASHLLRASHDAILIGSGTALADDPSLSCRLPGMQSRSPVRIVVDGRLRLATRRLNLVATAREIPTWIVTTSDADRELRSMLTGMGATVIGVEKDGSGHPQARAIVAALAERGVTRVLVEGGTAVAGSFLAAGLIDRMAVFRAPKMIGADGLAMAGELGVSSLESAPTYVRCGVGEIASDLVEFYKSA